MPTKVHMWTTGADWSLDKTLPGRSHSPLLKRANYEDLSAAGYGCLTPSTPHPVPWRSWHRLPSWQAYSRLAEHESSARVASLLARQLSLVFRQVAAAASGLFPLRAPHPQALQTQCRAAELAFHHSADSSFPGDESKTGSLMASGGEVCTTSAPQESGSEKRSNADSEAHGTWPTVNWQASSSP